MKEYVLNYYSKFKCVAGDCKHTCCAGWEMLIDGQSLNNYKNARSSFSGALKNGINFNKSKFKTDKKGRCAFLNENNLCNIIINLGENSLCQVCKDHPRFRTFFADRTEMGLGFCCEEVAKVVLSFDEKIAPVLISDDNNEKELDFIQKSILEFRSQALKIIQDRNQRIGDRIYNLLSLCRANVENVNFNLILKSFLTFERLDKSWTARLKALKKKEFTSEIEDNLSLYAEQFLANSLYRHLSGAEDTLSARARAIACVLGWWIVKNIFEQEKAEEKEDFDVLSDVVRAYSAEVEYSEKNLQKLFLLASKFVKLN